MSFLDDSDDEDDLLNSKGLTPREERASRPLVSQESPVEEAPSLSQPDPAVVEARACGAARAASRVWWNLNKSCVSNSVYWWEGTIPCFVRTDDNAYKGLDAKPRKGQVLVQFISTHSFADHCRISIVWQRELHENKSRDGWDEDKMELFRQEIAQRDHFGCLTDTKREIALRAEELMLQQILDMIRKQETAVKKPPSRPLYSSATSTHCLDNIFDDDQPTTPPPPAKAPTTAAPPTARPPTRITVKPGDIIEYLRPTAVASAENYQTATITHCWPKDRDLALQLSSGDMLPRCCQVRIVQRLVRGKLITPDYQGFVDLETCKLDSKNNGKILQVETEAQRVGKILQAAKEEILSCGAGTLENQSGGASSDPGVASSPTSGPPHTKRRRPSSLPLETLRPNKLPKVPPPKKRQTPVVSKPAAEPQDILQTLRAKLDQINGRKKARRPKYEEIHRFETALDAAVTLQQQIPDCHTGDQLQRLAADWNVDPGVLTKFLMGNVETLFKKQLEELTAKAASHTGDRVVVDTSVKEDL